MDVINSNGSNKSKVFLYGFIAVWAAVMLYLSKEINIWMDEAYTLDTTSAKYSFSGVVHQSYYFESQPPVYFILVWVWRKISAAVFWARLFSLISIALTAWYFFKIVSRYTSAHISRWLLVLFLLNPFIIFAALEIRLYAFLMFLSAAAVYNYLLYYTENSKKHLFIFLAISLVAMYTQYFFAFLIAGLLVATLVYSGFKKAFVTGLYILPVILIFLPNVFVMDDQLGMVQSQKDEMGIFKRMTMVLHSPQNLLLSLETLQVSRLLRWVVLFASSGLLIIAYATGYKKNKQNPLPLFKLTNFFLITAVTVVLMLALFIGVTGIDHQDRYFTIVLPLFVASFALLGVFNVLVSRLLFACFSLYLSALFIYHYNDPVKQYDYKEIAEYVTIHQQPKEPVLFYHSTIALPFRYYYEGGNATVPLPHEVPFDNSYMDNVKDTAELKHCIDSTRTGSRSFLLISDFTEPRYKDDENRKMVNEYLNSHYTLSFDTLYYGASKHRSLRIRRYVYP
jgi:hypothetical protein